MGKVRITITRFNRWSFITMLLSDVALATVIIGFGIRYYINRKKSAQKMPRSNPTANIVAPATTCSLVP